MNAFGYLIVIVGAYSIYMLKKNENGKVTYQNMNAYAGSIIIIILGVLWVVSSLDIVEPIKDALELILTGALCVILMTYGIVVAAMPLFFKKEMNGVLLRFRSEMQKKYRGCFSFSVGDKCYQAESEVIPKRKVGKQYQEGHNYTIWISDKFPGVCRINRYSEVWAGILYISAGVLFAINIIMRL